MVKIKIMKNKNNAIVIVGSSVAAVSAIEAVRSVNEDVSITVVTKEKNIFYSRPLISYLNITRKQFYYRDTDFFVKNKVRVMHGEVSEFKNGCVYLKKGKSISYGKLILATGGVPINPVIKGIDSRNVFSFTTYDDALKIKQNASGSKTAAVIGAGMIGIKAAEYLKDLGVSVSMIELLDKPFASVLDRNSGDIVARHIQKNIKLYLGRKVTEITGNVCVLDSGEKISSDITVIAVGVVPNTTVAEKSGLKIGKGIIVNSFMETSEKNVYAAGDCVESEDVLLCCKRVLPIWPVAREQGRIAGLNAVGVRTVYEGSFQMNSIDVFGLPIITLGISNSDSPDFVVSSDIRAGKYKKIIVKDERIIGAIFVGDINRSGIITGLIKDRIKVTGFREELVKDSFGYIYVPRISVSEKAVPVEI
ncbi:MAG: NADH-dependent phenylglyoxylate dehydrogenase subunit epsilon [Elusimicrobia bacterium ADurb.Bin231]|nr:MAG: NADH-dependent phenylglyoxylate dehydrogenase subunit epsilon [Elusimicrobia bacterium ADurb.Bin231]